MNMCIIKMMLRLNSVEFSLKKLTYPITLSYISSDFEKPVFL